MIDLHFWLLIGTGSIIGASLSTIFFQKKPIDSGLLITFGVVLSVIFRIIFDVFYLDASSHSLAGIEIMIAGLQSLPPSLVGAYAAIILKKNPGDVQ
jgi:hypothetical protein